MLQNGDDCMGDMENILPLATGSALEKGMPAKNANKALAKDNECDAAINDEASKSERR